MKKILSIVTLAVVLLFAVSAIAADRVVVVPLGGKKTVNVNVSNFTGDWQPNTTYQAGQVVQIGGSSYVAFVNLTSNPSTPNMGNWGLLAAKGDTGSQGPQGPLGTQGPQGIQGSVGSIGPQGVQGDAGPQGNPGPQGDPGSQGDPGAGGSSCWDLNQNYSCDIASEDSNGDGNCDPDDCQGGVKAPCEVTCTEPCEERPWQLLDNSGNLIANCKKTCDGNYYSCKSSTGYNFDAIGMSQHDSVSELDGENRWNLDTTLYIGRTNLSYYWNKFDYNKTNHYYDNASCTGNVYVSFYYAPETSTSRICLQTEVSETTEFVGYMSNWISEASAKGEGKIYGRVGGDGGKVYYEAPYTQHFTRNPAYQWGSERDIVTGTYSCVCKNVGVKEVYRIYENDPAVTGFQNSYNISPAIDWWKNYHNFNY